MHAGSLVEDAAKGIGVHGYARCIDRHRKGKRVSSKQRGLTRHFNVDACEARTLGRKKLSSVGRDEDAGQERDVGKIVVFKLWSHVIPRQGFPAPASRPSTSTKSPERLALQIFHLNPQFLLPHSLSPRHVCCKLRCRSRRHGKLLTLT